MNNSTTSYEQNTTGQVNGAIVIVSFVAALAAFILNAGLVTVGIQSLKKTFHNVLVLLLCFNNGFISLVVAIFAILNQTLDTIDSGISCMAFYMSVAFGFMTSYGVIFLLGVARFVTIRFLKFEFIHKLERYKYPIFFIVYLASLSFVLIVSLLLKQNDSVQSCGGAALFGKYYRLFILAEWVPVAVLIFAVIIMYIICTHDLWKLISRRKQTLDADRTQSKGKQHMRSNKIVPCSSLQESINASKFEETPQGPASILLSPWQRKNISLDSNSSETLVDEGSAKEETQEQFDQQELRGKRPVKCKMNAISREQGNVINQKEKEYYQPIARGMRSARSKRSRNTINQTQEKAFSPKQEECDRSEAGGKRLARSKRKTINQKLEEWVQPQAREWDQPQAGELDQPQAGELDQPQAGERDQLQAGKLDQPQAGELDQRKAEERDQLKAGERDQLKAGEQDQQATGDWDQREAGGWNQPRAREIDQPEAKERDQRKAGDWYQQEAGDWDQQEAGDWDQQEAGDWDQQEAGDWDQHAAGEWDHHEAKDRDKPKAGELIQPQAEGKGSLRPEDQVRSKSNNNEKYTWEIRAFETNLLVASTTVFLTAPFAMSFLYDLFAPEFMSINTRHIFYALYSIHHYIDPLIYAFRVPEIRRELKKKCSRQ